jgi:hypothetical protein
MCYTVLSLNEDLGEWVEGELHSRPAVAFAQARRYWKHWRIGLQLTW